MSGSENPYDSNTLQGNWYEDRYFEAGENRSHISIRPKNDDVENIPRIARRQFDTGPVFQYQNDETPQEHFKTVSMETYVQHHPQQDSVTARRMNCSPEELSKILDCKPDVFIPDYSLPERPPEKQYLTTYNKAFKRYF